MVKNVFLIALLALFLAGIVVGDSQDLQIKYASSHLPPDKKTVQREEEQLTPIDGVFNHSKQGKIIESPFVVGKSSYQDVIESDQQIVDIRSYTTALHKLHFNQIYQLKGKPNIVRYYKDAYHDQIKLFYQVAPNDQLKWILPKVTDDNPNPQVDHISVVNQSIAKEAGEGKLDELVSDMSLHEKIGQMIFAGISGTTMDADVRKLIETYQVGGFIFYADNLSNLNQTVKLINAIKSKNRENRFPVFLGIDQEGGRISKLPGGLVGIPSNQEIGAYNNANFSYGIGSLLGKQLRAFGLNLNFAPVLDINSNPENPVINDRSFGSSAGIVTKLGIQTMKGIQSQQIIPVVKHFPGHGDTDVDSHLQLPRVNKSLDQLNNMELIPFKQAIEEGAEVVMVAHILLPQIDQTYPASVSHPIITGILRKQLGFEGVIITDDLTMKAIMNNFEIGRAAVYSIKAGSDIVMVAHDFQKVITVMDAIENAVESGEISEQRIDASVKRIFELKQKYDLSNSTVRPVDSEALNQEIKAHLEEIN